MAKRSLNPLNTVTEESGQDHGSPPDETAHSINRRRKERKRLAKSADPSFMKFTTYIRKTTHIGVKTRLVSKKMELSDLVEELLSNWLKENELFKV